MNDDAPGPEGMRAAAAAGRVQWEVHAFERMAERGIPRAEVLDAIINGEAIETYARDVPFPRYLLLRLGRLPLHTVAAFDAEQRVCHVITAYRPGPENFEADLRTRRRRE